MYTDSNTEFVCHWMDRMAQKHGGIVKDKSGKKWDWGQALCREVHGPNWYKIPNLPDSPTDYAVQVAKEWEDGKIPEWVEATND